MMENFNFDPGLREAYAQQTYQRLLAESTKARSVKSVKTKNPGLRDTKQFSFVEKFKIVGQLIRETGSDIITVMRAKNDTLSA
jgi:hypothetical protein